MRKARILCNFLTQLRQNATIAPFIGHRYCTNAKEKHLISVDERFQQIPNQSRNKQTFLQVIDEFRSSKSNARGHVEFIKSALKYIKEYDLQKDLEIYKSLLNIFPKGPLIPQNVFQQHYMYYPQHQACCIELLDQMEWFGVQPDKEVHDIVMNAFGEWNLATRKIKRMLYWMPKLKHTNSFLDRRMVEGKQLDRMELAYIALKMISRDPGTQIDLVKVNDSVLDDEEQWLMSAQSQLQIRHLSSVKTTDTLYVDGPNQVYVMHNPVQYVSLFADSTQQYYEKFADKSEPDEDFENWRSEWEGGPRNNESCTIHQQKDEVILGLAVLGKVCRQSAAAWINHLQETNPNLRQIRVVLRTKQDETTVITDLMT